MLKLTLKPGEFLNIGENIKIIFSGGSANNIHLLVDAPREVGIARSSARQKTSTSPHYRETGISREAQHEITAILMREKNRKDTNAPVVSGSNADLT